MHFLITVCMAAIASAVFRILVPEGKLTKQISLLISCVFLLAGVSAISGAELDLDILNAVSDEVLISDTDIVRDVNKELQKRICGEMSDRIYGLLAESGICPEEIHVNVNISGLYSISITQVKAILPAAQADRCGECLALLRDELPRDIEVIVKRKE